MGQWNGIKGKQCKLQLTIWLDWANISQVKLTILSQSYPNTGTDTVYLEPTW